MQTSTSTFESFWLWRSYLQRSSESILVQSFLTSFVPGLRLVRLSLTSAVSGSTNVLLISGQSTASSEGQTTTSNHGTCGLTEESVATTRTCGSLSLSWRKNKQSSILQGHSYSRVMSSIGRTRSMQGWTNDSKSCRRSTGLELEQQTSFSWVSHITFRRMCDISSFCLYFYQYINLNYPFLARFLGDFVPFLNDRCEITLKKEPNISTWPASLLQRQSVLTLWTCVKSSLIFFTSLTNV